MPSDLEFAFGRDAVARGYLSQDDLDDTIVLLHDLERAGSRRHIWDVVIQRSLMDPGQVAEVCEAVHAPPPTPPEPKAKTPGSDLKPSRISIHEGEHTDAEIASITEPHLLEFLAEGRIRPHLLQRQAMSVGSGMGVDIRLGEAGIVQRHARLGRREDEIHISSIAGSAVRVNGVTAAKHTLCHGDLVELGEAMLVFLHAAARDAAQAEPATTGLLRAIEGPEVGGSLATGGRPLLIGRAPLCDLNLQKSGAALYHAQVAVGPAGVYIVDLRSPAGIRVNGQLTTRQKLHNGDVIDLGRSRLVYESTVEDESAMAPAEATVEAAADDEDDAESSFALPDQIEFLDRADEGREKRPDDVASERRASSNEETDDFAAQRTQPEPAPESEESFAPGSVMLLCLEGAIEGRRFVIDRERWVIGRGHTADIKIPDVAISREHAVVTLREGALEVEDMSSRNGIFVNHEQTKQARLKVGDTIRVGGCLFVVDRAVESE